MTPQGGEEFYIHVVSDGNGKKDLKYSFLYILSNCLD